jgi:hypothetical protein
MDKTFSPTETAVCTGAGQAAKIEAEQDQEQQEAGTPAKHG